MVIRIQISVPEAGSVTTHALGRTLLFVTQSDQYT
jgi:hypothetical protein